MSTRIASVPSRAGAGVALIALALDKYSWGRANAWLDADVTIEVAGGTWQVLVALIQVAFLLVAVASSRATVLRSLLALEAVLFIAVNAILIARDGQPRLFEWNYAAGNGGFRLPAVGTLSRMVALLGTRALGSPSRPASQQL